MKRGFFSSHRVLLTVILCLAFFIAGFYISPFVRVMTRVPEEEDLGPAGTASNEIQRTGAATRIFAIRNYLKSNSVQITEVQIQPGQLGLDELSFSVTIGEGWKILKFGSDRVYIARDVTGYGPGCFTLSIVNNDGKERLALYAYDDNGYQYLKESFKTPLSNFTEEEQAKLRGGITVVGEENLYKMLENYIE